MLYPEGTHRLEQVGTEKELGQLLAQYNVLRDAWMVHETDTERNIDDKFMQQEVQLCELAFEGQMVRRVTPAAARVSVLSRPPSLSPRTTSTLACSMRLCG